MNKYGKSHTHNLEQCRYYPDSPACILSQTQLGIQLQDNDFGTCIDSGILTSKFFWGNRKYCRKIVHTPSFMPKMTINDTVSNFSSFLSKFSHYYDDDGSSSFFTDHEYKSLQTLGSDRLLGKSIIYKKGTFESRLHAKCALSANQ